MMAGKMPALVRPGGRTTRGVRVPLRPTPGSVAEPNCVVEGLCRGNDRHSRMRGGEQGEANRRSVG